MLSRTRKRSFCYTHSHPHFVAPVYKTIPWYALAAHLLLLLLYISVPKYFMILYTLYAAEIFLIFFN